MNPQPLVSVIVNNYNYGRFLAQAIDSALNQTYPNIEVIVVDDGSTDDSRQVIASYGRRVCPVLKANGGQASALNAGFAHSSGEIIIFLDADDVLQPTTAQKVVSQFQRHPHLARVQYRLEITNTRGEPGGALIPPAYMPLPDGDFRYNVIALVNTSRTPTSGNAFSAKTLRRIMPIPEVEFRLCADFYLLRVSAMCAPVVALDEVGAYYRAHDSNGYFVSTINLNQTRQNVAREHHAHSHIRRLAERLDIKQYPEESIDIPDEIFIAQRMISLKLDPHNHPIQGDTSVRLCRRGIAVVLRRDHLSVSLKLLHLLWFVTMVFAPRRIAPLVAQQFVPETRLSLTNFLSYLQGRRHHNYNGEKIELLAR